MARLTEEEAYALDDFVTNNEITLGSNGTDWLTQREMRLWGMSNMTVNYLMTKAAADHKTPPKSLTKWYRNESPPPLFNSLLIS